MVKKESPCNRRLKTCQSDNFLKQIKKFKNAMRKKYIILVFCLTSPSLFANWTNWRGPNFNLSVEDQAFPSQFSDTKNVVWSVSIPGEGTSTPAIWGDTIYATCFYDGLDIALAFDDQGQKRWEAEVGLGVEGSHRAGTGANSSPVVDASGVYVYFKSGNLAKLSHSGEQIWKTNLKKEYSIDSHWWDEGTSPVLVDDLLIVAEMQQPQRRDGNTAEAYVVAFDKDSGKEAWLVDRDLNAPVESNDSYSTPLVATVDGEKQLVIWGADQLTGHSLKNGRIIWRCKNFNPNEAKNWRTIASHAIADDVAIVPYGRGHAVAGIQLGGKGDITKHSRLWEVERIGPDVPTPAIYRDTAIVLNDRGTVTAIEVKSGEVKWQSNLPRKPTRFYASPLVAGDRLICSREDGTVFICRLNDDGLEILAENTLPGSAIASPVAHGDRLYIRTANRLYCIGRQS